MDLYIDLKNLKSFIQSRHKDSFDDCLRMLKRQIHIIYNMEKTVLKEDSELQQLVLKLGSGRGTSEETDEFLKQKFPDRPIKSNSYINWNRKQLTSVFLIDDEDVDKLKNKGCLLIGSLGEELSVLSKLFCGNDYDYHYIYDLQKGFDSWERLANDNQILPCTDLIINDRYLFKNDVELVRYNLNQMLSTLLKNCKNKTNIIIFTINKFVLEFGSENAKKIIKNIVNHVTGINPNITFVTSNNNTLIPHDRFIISNYRIIRSGDTFLYFNTSGETITNGGSLDIDSMANNETYLFVESLLDKLQTNYRKIASINQDMIIGDNISRSILVHPD